MIIPYLHHISAASTFSFFVCVLFVDSLDDIWLG